MHDHPAGWMGLLVLSLWAGSWTGSSALAQGPDTVQTGTLAAVENAPLELDMRRELFVDDYLIGSMQGAHLKMHSPTRRNVALELDRPWEGPFCGYFTVIKDGEIYRLYYRGMPGAGAKEVTCYAESQDGKTFTRPDLGLFEVNGTRENNVILAEHRACHNFAPFLDQRPDVPKSQRFKALGGTGKPGLIAFASEDGIHWKPLQEDPVITQGAFDSQNVAFWSERENRYVCFFRIFESGVRSVARAHSSDFLHWSEPQAMTYGDTPREHLYTSQTHPYFRAPHLYIGFPMRFFPGQRVISEADADALEVVPLYRKDSSDGVFLTNREGNRYDRTFMEAFLRPGLDPGNWVSRVNMAARGVVPTSEESLGLYYSQHYAQPSHHLLHCSLRTDGFASLNAPYAGGEMITKPLIFQGERMVVNFSTSAAGSIQVEFQDVDGKPLAGYALEDCKPLRGDSIQEHVTFKEAGIDVSPLKGKPVRIRFVMKDADLYSIQFAPFLQ
jgi:hypothetical protein